MGTAFTKEGRLNLKNARHARSTEPLDSECDCLACTDFTRGALRHYVQQREILGLQLLTEHNLRFSVRLVEGARAAIVAGRFAAFKGAWGAAW